MSIQDLPPELVLHALRFVDIPALLAASRTCRAWRILASDVTLWKKLFLKRDAQSGVHHLSPEEAAAIREREGLPNTYKIAYLRPILRVTALFRAQAGYAAGQTKRGEPVKTVRNVGLVEAVGAQESPRVQLGRDAHVQIPRMEISVQITGSLLSTCCRRSYTQPHLRVYNTLTQRSFHSLFHDPVNPSQASFPGESTYVFPPIPKRKGAYGYRTILFLSVTGEVIRKEARAPGDGGDGPEYFCAAGVFPRVVHVWSCRKNEGQKDLSPTLAVFSRENGERLADKPLTSCDFQYHIVHDTIAFNISSDQVAFNHGTVNKQKLFIWNQEGVCIDSLEGLKGTVQCLQAGTQLFLLEIEGGSAIRSLVRDEQGKASLTPPHHSWPIQTKVNMSSVPGGLVTLKTVEKVDRTTPTPGQLTLWSQPPHTLPITTFVHTSWCDAGLATIGGLVLAVDGNQLLVWDSLFKMECLRRELDPGLWGAIKPKVQLLKALPIGSAVLLFYQVTPPPGNPGGVYMECLEPSLPPPI